MAVAKQGTCVTQSSSKFSVNSITVPLTVSAGSNLGVLLFVLTRGSSAGVRAVSSASRDGQNFTSVVTRDSASMAIRSTILKLIAPNTGTNDITVTLGGTNAVAAACAQVLTGVDQTDLTGATNSAEGNSTTPSVTVTTTVADNWVFDATQVNAQITLTVGANQTQIWNTPHGTVDNTEAASHEGPQASGGVTMSWSMSGSNGWITTAAEVKPAVSSVNNARRRQILANL